jgi:hypothetical protein
MAVRKTTNLIFTKLFIIDKKYLIIKVKKHFKGKMILQGSKIRIVARSEELPP